MQGIDNITSVIIELCRTLRVPYSSEEIIETVQSHPHFPSLATISDSVKNLGLSADAYRYEFKDLLSIDLPIIAHLNVYDGTFVLVKTINPDSIDFTADGKKVQTLTMDEFCKLWDGIVMTFSKSKKFSNADYLINRIVSNKLIIGLCLVAILSFCYIFLHLTKDRLHYDYLTFVVTKIIGIVFIIFMIKQESGEENALIHKICHFSKLSDCDGVMNSKGAKLFGIFNLSDIGLVWFVSSLIYLVISIQSTDAFLIPLKFLSILSVPFIFYSLSYQFIILKKFCPLCLAVMTMLIIDLIISLVSIQYSYILFKGIFEYWILLLIVLTIVIMVWDKIKVNIKKIRDISAFSLAYQRQIADAEFIDYQISKADKISVPITLLDSPIKITNTGKNGIITEVIGLNCIPCKESLEKIIRIIDYLDDECPDFQFALHVKEPEITIDSSKAALHLVAIACENDIKKTLSAIKFWYKNMDYDKFQRDFPIEINDNHFKILKNHQEWIIKNNVTATPTAYLNNVIIPNEINIENLKYYFE